MPNKFCIFVLTTIVLCYSCFYSGLSLGLATDNEQPIHIQANRAERNEKLGTTVYEGNVVVTQGSLKLEAVTVTIFSKENKVSHIIASGNPAHFEQQPNNNEPSIHAQGKTIMYHLDLDRIRIKKEASLIRQGSIVKGEQIDYFIKDEIVKAQGTDNKSHKSDPQQKRIEVVIQPSKKAAD